MGVGRSRLELRGGPMLLQSDLKLNEWLIAALLGTDSTNYTTFTTKDSVLTHEVKFEVVTGGELTPTWKLINATVNPSGTFLSSSRGIRFQAAPQVPGGTQRVLDVLPRLQW
jgi:hypothetical protein